MQSNANVKKALINFLDQTPLDVHLISGSLNAAEKTYTIQLLFDAPSNSEIPLKEFSGLLELENIQILAIL
ncbi:hypothetical protein [Leptospira interrogans]|uniref:hypothetical protein n=1 Tax=Leptospira interrogans TaxID=173 RepID=UPI0007733251|nr:hypothetical protein [Leptospira interrogans]